MISSVSSLSGCVANGHQANSLTTGVGAGILARRSDLWFTCVPHLWRLFG